MSQGLLIVISGPGAVGKDTLIEHLQERHPELRYSVSFTTRLPRPTEVDGEHYTFVDRAEFERLVGEGEFLEHAVVNGHWYGTSAARVAKLQEAGHDVILKIDVQGADQVRAKRPDGVYVFIAPPSMEELWRRRVGRGAEPPEVLRARQDLAKWEMSFAGHYDHVVINDDLDRALGEVEALLDAERAARAT